MQCMCIYIWIFHIYSVFCNINLYDLWVLSWAILGEGGGQEGPSYVDIWYFEVIFLQKLNGFSNLSIKKFIKPNLKKLHFTMSSPSLVSIWTCNIMKNNVVLCYILFSLFYCHLWFPWYYFWWQRSKRIGEKVLDKGEYYSDAHGKPEES